MCEILTSLFKVQTAALIVSFGQSVDRHNIQIKLCVIHPRHLATSATYVIFFSILQMCHVDPLSKWT